MLLCVFVLFATAMIQKNLFDFMLAGDNHLTPRLPTEATVVSSPARNVDLEVTQDSLHLPMQKHGAPVPDFLSEEDPNSHPSSGPVTNGDLKQVCLCVNLLPSYGPMQLIFSLA